MVAVYYAGLPVPPQRIALDVSKNLAREVQRLDEQAALILSDLEDGNRWSPPASRTYSFFLFESSRLIEWSSNDFVPTAAYDDQDGNRKRIAHVHCALIKSRFGFKQNAAVRTRLIHHIKFRNSTNGMSKDISLMTPRTFTEQ